MIDLVERVLQLRDSFAENPARIAGAAIGVVWGTAALIMILAWGTGFRGYMRGEMARYGRPSIELLPGVTSSGFAGVRPGVPIRFSRRDAIAVEWANLGLIEAALPQHFSRQRVQVEAGNRVRRLDLTGTDERFPYYRSFRLSAGRYFDRHEVAAARAVAVLGHDAAIELFGGATSAIGRSLRVEGQSFEVVGVAAAKGRQYVNTSRLDNRLLLVPLTAAETRLGYAEDLARLSLFPRPGVSSRAALDAALRTLGPRCGFAPRDVDAIRTYDLTQALRASELFYAGFMVFLGAASGVTLAVGGLAIANVELATLADRAVEIGVAKALGARDRTLVGQVVLEAVTVSVGAALLGVVLGLSGCAALAAFAPKGAFPVPVVAPRVVAIALLAVIGVAVLSAVAPALRVRKIEVATALRAAL